MHHAPNHVGFGISPELNVVQDGVHGSPEPYMVQGVFRNLFVYADYKIVNLATPSKENPYNLKLLHLAYIMLFGEQALTPSFQSTFGGGLGKPPAKGGLQSW
jgi:hypothetical protein